MSVYDPWDKGAQPDPQQDVPPPQHWDEEPPHEPPEEFTPRLASPLDLGEQHQGHARLAYRLAKWHSGRLIYVAQVGWFVWDGSRWREDLKGRAHGYVLQVIRRSWAEARGNAKLERDVKACDSGPGIRSVLDVAARLEQFAHTVDELDPDPYLLNTPAGTLDLRTMQTRAHDPGDLITKITRGTQLRPDGPDTWSAFLEQVLPDPEVRGFLRRLVGVSLLGTIREHVLGILTGVGANGKTVFYTALVHALGDYGLVAEPNLLMHRDAGHPTSEMDLWGRRLVVVSESDRDRRLAEATVKRLTGGDEIRARRMRRDFVSFTPSHTTLLITNHLPRVSGDDPALWRRLVVIPWLVVFDEDERDPELTDRLRLAADEILAWAVAGHADYVERGSRLAPPDKVKLATEGYRSDSDDVARFLSDRTYPAGVCPSADLWAAWQQWAKAEGVEVGSRHAFGEALDRAGYPAERTMTARIRRGLTLLADELEDQR